MYQRLSFVSYFGVDDPLAQIMILDGTMLSFVHPDEDADFWKMTVRGTVPLWSQITALIDSWERTGRPSLEEYEIDVDQGGRSSIHLQALSLP